MPYGKQEAYCYMPSHGKYWARRGYACVIQDVRGRWGSEGVYEPFVNEAKDGYETLDWVAAQPWCDGNIGMTGESYYGYTQWAVAPLGHPNLKCIAPGDTAADIYASWIYNDNAFCLSTMGGWAYVINGKQDYNEFLMDPWHLPLADMPAAAGHPSKAYTEWMEHQARDEYWDRVNVCQRYADVKIPALHWGGWYDVFLNGTIGGWEGVRSEAGEEARDKQWLMIGATDHELSPEFTGRIGRLELKDHGYAHDRIKAFMDHWLKGEDNGVARGGRVRYFTMGGQRVARRGRVAAAADRVHEVLPARRRERHEPVRRRRAEQGGADRRGQRKPAGNVGRGGDRRVHLRPARPGDVLARHEPLGARRSTWRTGRRSSGAATCSSTRRRRSPRSSR